MAEFFMVRAWDLTEIPVITYKMLLTGFAPRATGISFPFMTILIILIHLLYHVYVHFAKLIYITLLPYYLIPFNLNTTPRDFNDFDDSMSEALNMANNILVNYNYSDADKLPNISGNLSTFYFNNIYGFKTNFNEALVNINFIKTKPSLIAFCETNFKQDAIDDYEIKNYNSEHLYAKHNKSKGSGIKIYYKNSHLFQRIDVRNNYFECMGGRFKTNDSQFYIIVVYRYHNNIKTFF